MSHQALCLHLRRRLCGPNPRKDPASAAFSGLQVQILNAEATWTIPEGDTARRSMRSVVRKRSRRAPSGWTARTARFPESEIRSPATGFVTSAGWPTLVEVQAVDDCKNPVTTGRAIVSFSNGETPLALQATSTLCRWSATWASTSQSTRAVNLTAKLESSDESLKGEITGNRNVRANPDLPAITPGGIINGIGQKSEAPVAPGSRNAIQGSKLSSETARAPTGNLPVLLSDNLGLRR